MILGFKSVELQIAIPRTQDATKLQEQLSKQSQHFQNSLTQTQVKQEEIKRQQVNHSENVDYLNVKSDGDRDTFEDGEDGNGEPDKDNKSDKIEHPYLGVNVDYSK